MTVPVVTEWRRCPTCDVGGWRIERCWCCGGEVVPWWCVGRLPPWTGLTIDELLERGT